MAIEPSKHRKALLATVTLLLTTLLIVIVIEIVAFVVISVTGTNFYLPLELNDPDKAGLVEQQGRIFSHELGWEPSGNNPHGYRGKEKDIEDAVIALFGDSYTKGFPKIEQSWAYLLEQNLGRPVLNFGVGGYGTDQAYLRFEKRYVGKMHTPYVALLIMSENISRVMNRYRGFYTRKRSISRTKPMFYLHDSGNLELLANPLESAEQIRLLGERQFLEEIGKTDYWYGHFDKFGLNEIVHFPYSWFLLKALPYYVERGTQHRLRNYREYEDLYKSNRATQTLLLIIQKFIERANQENSIPLVVFLPNWKDLVDYQDDGKTVYDDFFQELRNRHHALTFDALEYFVPLMQTGEDVPMFFRSRLEGHYNPYGEQVISSGFAETLRTVDEEFRILKYVDKLDTEPAISSGPRG